jgi:hypothetical protein
MSSTSWPWALTQTGVFSTNPKHSPFAGYNNALVG